MQGQSYKLAVKFLYVFSSSHVDTPCVARHSNALQVHRQLFDAIQFTEFYVYTSHNIWVNTICPWEFSITQKRFTALFESSVFEDHDRTVVSCTNSTWKGKKGSLRKTPEPSQRGMSTELND